MMDKGFKQALRDNHQDLRRGLLVENILPDFRQYLTDIEYLRVRNQPSNVDQVDELLKVLLTKENRHFDGFCRVCECNGYCHWARQLRAAASGHKYAEGFAEADCSILYQKAIRDNPTITLHISKAMTFGPPQVGKTTLHRRLLGLSQPAISSSTDVMERADTVMCLSDCAIPSDDIGSGDEHSSDSEDEASSDGSDDDLGQSVPKRCKYESNVYKADRDEWVVLNHASGLLSLVDFLKKKIDVSSTPVRKCFGEAPIQPSSDNEAPLQPRSDDEAHIDAKAPIQPSSDAYMADGSMWEVVNYTSRLLSLLTLSVASTQIGSHFDEAPIQPLSDDEASIQPLRDNMSHRMYQELQKLGIATSNVTLPDAHLLQFIDCGGQLACHDVLPLFVNIPAIYLYVFNASKELTECPIDELCSPRGEKKYSAESALSVAEMITRSVMTVHLLGDKKVQLPSEVKCDGKSPKPYIVLVGTHLDELDEKDRDARLKAINETLRKAVHSELHELEGMVVKDPKHYGMFFPVSKVSHEKCTSKYLKRRIRKEAKRNAVKVEVPVRWYLRQLLAMSRGEKPSYAYSKLWRLSKEEGSITDIGEFHAMVTYFHALGLLIHFCGADVRHTEDSDCLIYTDPSYLFKNISKLYRVQFEDEVEGSKIKLKHEGKLTEKALEELGVELNHHHFMDLLVHLFIGAEIESPEGIRTLFVPSVLVNPKSTEDATSSRVDAVARQHSLCFAVAFKRTSFIPCGVFAGMIARLQSTPQWKIYTRSISRTRMTFMVGALGTVNVLDHATHISVEIDRHDGLKPEQYQEYRDTVIQATADSYCFLFHSKADKDPGSGTCSTCTDRPYLVLGQTCRSCPPQPGGTRKVRHFAELKVENCVPVSVRCLETPEPKLLEDNAFGRVLFQNISHDAVVKEQHTSPTPIVVAAEKVPRHVPPETDLAKRILDLFRERFHSEMDATVIVSELEHQSIISKGDQRKIGQEMDPKLQNQFLHACLRQKCTPEALMDVCGIIINMKGDPKMNKLGEDMKRELEKVSQMSTSQTSSTGPHTMEGT